MINTIIIDDEFHGRQALQLAVSECCPEINVMKVCGCPVEGIETIKALNPQLVFLDVQMPKLSGFDVLRQLEPINFQVIFVTSYDKYALKAIKFSAIDYLLKPVDVDELEIAIERAKRQMHTIEQTYKLQSMLNNVNYGDKKIERLAVPTFEGINFFNVEEIIYCEAEGNYTNLVLRGGRKELVSKNLKEFESMLSSAGYVRVHNSYLINSKHIEKYIKGEGGYVILSEGHHVDISRRRKEAFLNSLHKV